MNNDIERKLRHAEFFLAKLHDTDDAFEMDAYFAALLPCLRAAQNLLVKALGTDGWNRIDRWARQNLDALDERVWAALRNLRNDELHNRAVEPQRVMVGDYFGGMFGPDYMGGMFGGTVERQVSDPGGKYPSTGSHEIFVTSTRMLELVKALVAASPTL
jgi:hypothetical protein